ncbi:MAG: GFA family protein [Gammaproteobacteria bacterium]|nr:GFA family protein [Gammaproteobacteria bacterium]MCZ6716032.1 GFA family protein [Gammaproteobacteria bacterium]MCZ6827319.1 GFA family protein [Gammaproteobacteria bacterium]MCZ6912989.1 GFA family protein [Pseudomonadota bacterium]
MDAPQKIEYRGGCHCGTVRYKVRAPTELEVFDCNCSMCVMTGYRHLIVSAEDFTLLKGKEALSEYCFNTGIARHLFCRECGIKSFYVPRSHPDGYSVNLRCLDPGQVGEVSVLAFDGTHWEDAISGLAKD